MKKAIATPVTATPNTEYVIEAAQYPAPLGGEYAPIEQFNDGHYVQAQRMFELATRIVEIKPGEIVDYQGSYENYVHFCGDDHLDADTVILKARKEKKKAREGAAA